MSVDAKTVLGRRTLHFNSMNDVVIDAEKLVASATTRTLGNWPLSQLLTHLTTAINSSIDGISTKAPWSLRLVGPFLKKRLLHKQMPPGFKVPKDIEPSFFPAGGSPQEACQQLRMAVARMQNEKMTARHPVLGKLTHDEWAQLHLRHAELHLSFAVPG